MLVSDSPGLTETSNNLKTVQCRDAPSMRTPSAIPSGVKWGQNRHEGRSVSLWNRAADIFVGREREMDQLRAALEEAMSGQGRMVMLSGEPGIGKTHIAQVLAGIAVERGAQMHAVVVAPDDR